MTINTKTFMFDAGQLEKFIELPYRLYRDDSRWIAPFRRSTRWSLSEKNPYFRQGKICNVLVSSGGEVIGRASAMVPHAHGDKEAFGLIGFFECEEDYGGAQLLLDAALEWLRGQGVCRVLGPMNFDTWHSYRFMVQGFDRKPFLMEPYNKRYYPEYFLRHGFTLEKEYFSKAISDVSRVRDTLAAKTAKFLESGEFQFENIRRERLQEDLKRLYRMSLKIFAGNWFYRDISEVEFLSLYDGVGQLLDPDLMIFAKDRQGKDAGFIYAFPDHRRAIAAMRGDNNWLAKIRFLLNNSTPDSVNVKSMGVLPEHRNTRLGGALMLKVYEQIARKGYPKTNHCLIVDGNYSGGYDGSQGEVCAKYALYARSL